MGLTLRTARRSLGSLAHITRNRLAGRSFAFDPRTQIFIETSGRCNLACRFCAYADKVGPGVIMPLPMFRDIVDQSLDLGFSRFWLTPMLGEIFADPGAIGKFRFLERREGVRRYGFYSNFIMPREGAIRDLAGLEKLHGVFISIYGHDRETFERVTRKPGSQYDRLLANLRTLREVAPAAPFGATLGFNVRTTDGHTAETLPETELTGLLRDIAARTGATIDVAEGFDSWGGTIRQEDLDPLGIRITDGRFIYKHGVCRLVLSSVQIMADGTVHACACRDVDGSLVVGNLAEAPLGDILSLDNPAYRALIEAQQKGRFGPNCQSCAMYSSIYDARGATGPQAAEVAVMPLDRALARLGPAS